MGRGQETRVPGVFGDCAFFNALNNPKKNFN